MTGPDGVYSARAFGARGDGVADDTAAIQATIDAALGPDDPATAVRHARGPVYLPPGAYRVTAPLRITSADGLTFRGAGGSSRLAPVGDLPAVLDINGVAYCTFRDFRIAGRIEDHAVADAIRYYWDLKTAARSTNKNAFERIVIQDVRFATALRIGVDMNGLQVDQTTYRDISIEGRWQPGEAAWWQHGLYVGDGLFANNLDHWGYGLNVYHCAVGVHVHASQFSLWGGAFGANGTDLFANTLTFFSVQGVRSEGAGRLFESIGPSGNPATYTLSDVVWLPNRVADDLEFIRMKAGGCLVLTNLQVPGDVRVRLASGPTLGQTLKLTGIVAPGTLEEFLGGAPSATAAIVEGYYQSDAGNPGQLTPGAYSSVAPVGPGAARPALPRTARGVGVILKGQRTARVQHGLGFEPRDEDVGVRAPARVWLSGSNDRELIFTTDAPAPSAGITFRWSARVCP